MVAVGDGFSEINPWPTPQASTATAAACGLSHTWPRYAGQLV
ncbi:hypothetical protein DLM_4265 [Aquitalea magnusonii]|uniref:Uncharacterized protein n=1 Tax=Aquitalea magnusonii TaxID=332411 RepID=A0A3G9GW01_9NEIS|nr:hypothetical protein DLM_4265 [Aquitalea magnusonii]